MSFIKQYFHCPFHEYPKHDPILSKFNTVHTLTFWYFNVNISQEGTNTRRQVAVVTKFRAVAPNIWGFSLWNLIHIILLALRILRWPLNIWKLCEPLVLILSSHIWVFVPRDFFTAGFHNYFSPFLSVLQDEYSAQRTHIDLFIPILSKHVKLCTA